MESGGVRTEPPAGWYPDPLHPDVLMQFDGRRWTGARVIRAAVPPPPRGTLPARVAVWAVLCTALPLVVGRTVMYLLAHFRWPIAAYIAVGGAIAYSPGLLLWWQVGRRHMRRHSRDAVGFRARWIDLAWGPGTWLAAVCAEVLVGSLLVALRVPFVSNTDSFGDVHGRRGYVVALLLLAVLVAPIAEEVIFRGLLLRGLLSQIPPWAAITVQAVLFGAAHVAPERGWGNIGLALVLASVGAVFGAAAYLSRRLAPSIIAHAMVNGIALAIVFSR